MVTIIGPTAGDVSSGAATSGCSVPRRAPAQRGPAAPPVFLDGEEIAEEDIAREAQNHAAATAPEARAAAARALIIRRLLLKRAAELGLVAMPERDAEGREETGDEALIRMVLAAEVEPQVPGENECQRYYELNRGKFAAKPLYEASHILFEPQTDDDAGWSAARLAAATAMSRIGESESAFRTHARAHSACPSGAVGGSLGQLQHGDLVREIETALEALAPGEMARMPIRSRFGMHVVRLDRRVPGRELPFEAVIEKIRARLASRAFFTAATRYVTALAAGSVIEGVSLDLGPGS